MALRRQRRAKIDGDDVAVGNSSGWCRCFFAVSNTPEAFEGTPFLFVWSTRANVDCVGHAVRATDVDQEVTVLSIDGGPHLSKRRVLEACGSPIIALLPFVWSVSARLSHYVRIDDQAVGTRSGSRRENREIQFGDSQFRRMVVRTSRRRFHEFVGREAGVAGISVDTGKTRCWNCNNTGLR